MYRFKKIKSLLLLVIIPFFLLLSNCSERSEYGEANDYEKFGADANLGNTDTSSTLDDKKQPTVASVSPTDNTTFNNPATTISVIFSEAISTSTITTNTIDSTCSGSLQLSSDNFSTCIKMSSILTSSDNDTTFTVSPSSNLSGGTTHKLRITTSAKDNASNPILRPYTSDGFTTTPSGTGTIQGNVKKMDGSDFNGVSINFSIYGSSLSTDNTTDSSGNFNRGSIDLGIYTLEYSADNFKTATQTAILEKDTQTLNTATQIMIPASCSGGNVSGTIKDAVTGDTISGVLLSVRVGSDNRTGDTISGKTDTTDSSGAYTISSLDAGSFTIQGTKTGLIPTYFNVTSCSGLSNKNANMTSILAEGEMRIVLSWEGIEDFDSHLEIPCTSGTCSGSDTNDPSHLWYNTNQSDNVTFTGVNTIDWHQWSNGDYVTLDQDNTDGSATSCGDDCGPETITISKIRSGSYRYHVHAWDRKGDNTTHLADNSTVVQVFYDIDQSKNFYVPSSNGDLWTVFDYDNSSGFTTLNTMSSEDNQSKVDDH